MKNVNIVSNIKQLLFVFEIKKIVFLDLRLLERMAIRCFLNGLHEGLVDTEAHGAG